MTEDAMIFGFYSDRVWKDDIAKVKMQYTKEIYKDAIEASTSAE